MIRVSICCSASIICEYAQSDSGEADLPGGIFLTLQKG